MRTIAVKTDCTACGGAGWLPSRPEGDSACPYCIDGKITEQRPARRARIGMEQVTDDGRFIRAAMPENYKVTGPEHGYWTVEGYDKAGWTLDGYVLPRLASGLIFGEEVHDEG